MSASVFTPTPVSETLLPVYRTSPSSQQQQQDQQEVYQTKRRRISAEVKSISPITTPVALSVSTTTHSKQSINAGSIAATSEKSVDSRVSAIKNDLSPKTISPPSSTPPIVSGSTLMQQQQQQQQSASALAAMRRAEDQRKQQGSKAALQEATSRPCSFAQPSTAHFNFLIPSLPIFADAASLKVSTRDS